MWFQVLFPPHPSVLSPEGFLQAFLWVITAILVLGAAVLNAVLQEGPHQSGVEGDSHIPYHF